MGREPGTLRRGQRLGITADEVALIQVAQVLTRGEDLAEVTAAHHVEVIQAEAAAFTPADEEQAEALAVEVAQQQPGPAVHLEDGEDAGRTDAAQLRSLAADEDVQHVVAAARARCSLQRLHVTDAEDAHGAVVA